MVKISVDFTSTLAYSKRLWCRRNDLWPNVVKISSTDFRT